MPRPSLRVATICTGNICRSPMAEVILTQLVAQAPTLSDAVIVSSAGTARWHVGSEMDPRARAALDRAGYHRRGSLGTYADDAFLHSQDIILVMTQEHEHDVRVKLEESSTQIILWRNLLEPGKNLDVADPYYGDERTFDECLDVLVAGSELFLATLPSRLAGPSS